MAAKLILEKLPLEPNDILLVITSELFTQQQLAQLKEMFEQTVRPRLPHKNEILIIPFGLTLQAIRPFEGKFKIVNERLTVCTEENL